MNELVVFSTNEEDSIKVDGRQLHMFLGVETEYAKWMSRMCAYGFEEGKDYSTFLTNRCDGRPGKPLTNHNLTLDMAKELCMLQRTEKGKQARQYFIQIEKEWNSPEKVMARALILANRTIENRDVQIRALSEKIEADRPKVVFANAVNVSKTSILIGELAKLIKQNGYDIGQNRLFEWLRQQGFIMKHKNEPTQKSMEMKLFEVHERTINNPDGSIRITRTPKVTGKGQIYFVNRFIGGKV
jgi:anti-repressor protein